MWIPLDSTHAQISGLSQKGKFAGEYVVVVVVVVVVIVVIY
jgi:hypothetical protein